MRHVSRVPLLVLLLAGCAGDAPDRGDAATGETPPAGRYGGTAVVASIGGDVPDINPLTSTDGTADNLQRYVLFTPVVYYDENLEAAPGFAKGWEVNADTTEITFHLRDDVYFHDGVKSTAHDLKFFYDRARDPETAYPTANLLTNYGDAEVVDSFTFRVKMRPHADYMDLWRKSFALPRHILESVPPAEMRSHPYGTEHPVGNGPFRFTSHVRGQSWAFEANPNHPAELGGRPYLDRIVYRVAAEATTALTELLSGRIDYYLSPPPEQAGRIRAAENARLHSYAGRSKSFIVWNTRREPFSDPRVRRAITMGIDRQAIVDGILYGYGAVAGSTVSPFHWAHDSRAGADIVHDPAGARALLAEAGWEDRDGDGIREDASGRPLRIEIMTNQGNRSRADILQVVQADLKKIGIDVQPLIIEWGVLTDRVTTSREFDGSLFGFATEFRVDDSNLFHCDQRHGPYQWAGYCDPETDRLLDTLQTIVSREAARPVWQQYQRKIAEDQPFTFLFFQEQLAGIHERLQGVQPDARGDWLDAQRWWIVPGMRDRPGSLTPAPEGG